MRPFSDEHDHTWLKQFKPAIEMYFAAIVCNPLGGSAILNGTATDEIAVRDLVQIQPALSKREVTAMNGPPRDELREDRMEQSEVLRCRFISEFP